MPRVSVVMPAYNAARTIVSAIDSALEQQFADIEVVVVDDGSSDDTTAVVERITDRRVRLLRQANAGPSSARNAGVEAAAGELVAMLDADDLWLPTYLEAAVAALDAAPEGGFAWTDAWVYDEVRREVRVAHAMAYQRPPARPPADADGLLRELVQRNFVYGSTTVRRSVLLEVGGYRSSLTASEDYDLWLRILSAGYAGVRVRGNHAIYRRRPGTNSDDPVRVYDCMRRMYESVAADPRVAPEVAAAATANAARWRQMIVDHGASVSPLRAARGTARRLAKRVLRPERWLAVDDAPAPVAATLRRSFAVDAAGAIS